MLWNVLRPIYNRLVSLLGSSGLERVINGTDRILVSPDQRGTTEVYEPDVWCRLMSELRRGDVFVDVGASFGLYTIAAAKRVGASGRVIAFEPDEETYRSLVRNIRLNELEEIVRPVHAAVGKVNGAIGFAGGKGFESRICKESPLSVKSVTLDNFFREVPIDVLKIDVEGFEQEVILGARDLLSGARAPRLVFVEAHPYNWRLCDTTSDSLLTRLRDFGYATETITGTPLSTITEYGEFVARRLN